MGLLDEAIREHLELKRRHGADDEEIARQEAEAFGPAPLAEEDEEEPFAGFESAGEADTDEDLPEGNDRAAEAGLTGTRVLPEFEWHGSTSTDVDVPSFVVEEPEGEAEASAVEPREPPPEPLAGPEAPDEAPPGDEEPPGDEVSGATAPPAITHAPTEAFTPVDTLGPDEPLAPEPPFEDEGEPASAHDPLPEPPGPGSIDEPRGDAVAQTEPPGEDLAAEAGIYAFPARVDASERRPERGGDELTPELREEPGVEGLHADEVDEEEEAAALHSEPQETFPGAPVAPADLESGEADPGDAEAFDEEPPLSSEAPPAGGAAYEDRERAEGDAVDEPTAFVPIEERPLYEPDADAEARSEPLDVPAAEPDPLVESIEEEEAALAEDPALYEEPVDDEELGLEAEPHLPAADELEEEDAAPPDTSSARGFFEDTQQHEGVHREQREGRDPDFEG